MQILSVDIVESPNHKSDQCSMYVELELDNGDCEVRVYKAFPTNLYEDWEETDFLTKFYKEKIEKKFPYKVEEEL